MHLAMHPTLLSSLLGAFFSKVWFNSETSARGALTLTLWTPYFVDVLTLMTGKNITNWQLSGIMYDHSRKNHRKDPKVKRSSCFNSGETPFINSHAFLHSRGKGTCYNESLSLKISTSFWKIHSLIMSDWCKGWRTTNDNHIRSIKYWIPYQ